MAKLTKFDLDTLRLALNYAVQEREGYVGATERSVDDKAAHDRALRQIARFEKLHEKLFQEPTPHQQMKNEEKTAKTISLFDLAARARDV